MNASSRPLLAAPAIAALALALGAVTGCREEAPVEYPSGRPFSLASWTLRVGAVERLAVPPAGFTDLRRDMPDADVLAVHVELTRQEDAEEGAEWRQSPEFRFLKLAGAFRLRDEEGVEYRLPLPVLERHFGFMKTGAGLTPPDRDFLRETAPADLGRWVLLYGVPRDSRGFTLLIRNNRPREGEPRVAAVRLGR